MNTPLALDAYVAVVEAHSISAAARELGLPRATVSRQLARLEEHLGVRLVQRSTRRMTLTIAGEELYKRACRIVEETRAAEAAVRQIDDEPRGILRVSIPSGLSADVMGAIFSSFAARFPEVQLHILATARAVDMRAERIDVAVRAGDVVDPTLVARTFVNTELIAVANPGYLSARGEPKNPEELERHRCLTGFARGVTPRLEWPLRAGGSISVTPWFSSSEPALLRVFALDQIGIALIPKVLVLADLQSGDLVPVLASEIGVRANASLVYPERDFLDPKVRAFIDHAVEWIAANPFEE